MIIRIKVKRTNPLEEKTAQPCIFRASCQGACEWCETNPYTEACVPFLQAKVAELTKAIKDSDEIIDTLERKLAKIEGRCTCLTCRHNGLDYVKQVCYECKGYDKWKER